MTLGPVLTLTDEDRHWWFSARTRALLGLLDAEVSRGRGAGSRHPGEAAVLDVGCGAGNMTHHLARYGRVTGIDSFSRPLAVSRSRGYAVGQATAEAIPFRDGTFDLVALLDVLEHCDGDAHVLGEVRRVISDNGLLAVTVPAFPFLWSENDVINGHRRRYTPAALRQLLVAGGFDVLRLTCNNSAILPLAVGLNLLRRARKKELSIAAPTTDEDAYQVEMQPAHPVLNAVLGGIGALEAGALRFMSLPVGTGLIAIASPRVSPETARV